MRMSGAIAVCVLICAFAGSDAQAQKSADISQIVALLQKHDDALNQHDLNGVMSVFAPKANIVVLAWLASMCKFSDSKDGKKREYELNVSGVFRKIGGKWYFQSLHYSNLTGGAGN